MVRHALAMCLDFTQLNKCHQTTIWAVSYGLSGLSSLGLVKCRYLTVKRQVKYGHWANACPIMEWGNCEISVVSLDTTSLAFEIIQQHLRDTTRALSSHTSINTTWLSSQQRLPQGGGGECFTDCFTPNTLLPFLLLLNPLAQTWGRH